MGRVQFHSLDDVFWTELGNPLKLVDWQFLHSFGGVFFPITILPGWLQKISYFLPITYSLRAIRHALLQSYPFQALGFDILILALFSVVLLPLSVYAFKVGVRRAKKDGSLTHY